MESNNPKITFVVPCYNVERYVESCISSIAKQDYSSIEIIPVDDGSKDNTGPIIDKLASRDNRIRPIHKANAGVSAARNTGIDAATGEYIVFVDGDDYISANYADYMLSMIAGHDADFALSVNCYTQDNEKQVSIDHVLEYTPEDATTLLLGPRVVVGSWNKIYKLDFLKNHNIRFSTEMFYGEGLYFITRCSQMANKVIVGEKKVYYYRRNNYASVCTTFNIRNFYNGSASIDAIERDLMIKTPKVLGMLGWQRCQFKMGTVVRIKSADVVSEYKDYYKESLSYVRRHLWESLPLKGVGLYKKGLLIGTAISPWIMAKLDVLRRKRIQSNSVSEK